MDDRRNIVDYRLKRAQKSLEEAHVLIDANHREACVNRLYYACFYGVSALLLLHGFSSSKHTGVRSLFNLHFVKTEAVSSKLARIYNDLFRRRQESDYVDLVEFESLRPTRNIYPQS